MKKLLDPIANAKSIGFLFIILGIVDLLIGISRNDYILALYSVIYFTIGYGLRREKRWSIDALGAFALFDFFYRAFLKSQGTPLTFGMMMGLILNIAAFYWLFQAKKQFKK